MIVRNLPTISKRWPPSNSQKQKQSQPNQPPRSNSQTSQPQQWKYKQKQANNGLNKTRSSTTVQQYATRPRGARAQPPNPNKWRVAPKQNPSNTNKTMKHPIQSMQAPVSSTNKASYKVAKHNPSNRANRSTPNNHHNASNRNTKYKSNNFTASHLSNPQPHHQKTKSQQKMPNIYSQATQQSSKYAGSQRKLYTNAYIHNKKLARQRNISNHSPNKPLPVSRKASTTSTTSSVSSVSSISSNRSNGYNMLPVSNPRIMKSQSEQAQPHSNTRKKPIGYYNNTSIRKPKPNARAPRYHQASTNRNSNNAQANGYHNKMNKYLSNPVQDVASKRSASNNASNIRKNAHGIRRRLHDIFARDKLIKWVYHSKSGIYEPIFVVMDHHSTNDKVIIGRDSRGVYKLYQKRNVKEAPPSDHDVIIINAVEQLLRGYQHRFKATSLRKQKEVEIVQRSKAGWVASASTDAIFANVIGFEDKTGHITNVVLQDTVNGVKHAFPVSNVQENHTINIETNETLFPVTNDKKAASISQYVKPSYWLSEDTESNSTSPKAKKEDETKRKEIEKQQQGLLQRIEIMKNETKKLQNVIKDKIKAVHNVDLKDKADKTGIAAVNVMWTEILKRNKTLQTQIASQRGETDSWRKIAAEHQNENRLLKQQMTHVKSSSKTQADIQRLFSTDKEKTETLRHELRKKQDTITDLTGLNTVLQQQLVDLQRDMRDAKVNAEKTQLQMELTQSKIQIVINDDEETDEKFHDYESENMELKKQLAEMERRSSTNLTSRSRAGTAFSMYSTNSELMQRGGGLKADSNCLTVKDTLTEFHSLRDQQYHNLHIELKKTLKSYKAKTWHKLYINEVCHGFMFDVLQWSYKSISKYSNAIYQRIGGTLCIEQVESDKQKQNEQMDFVFLFYIKENHKILFNDFKNKEMDKLIDKTKQLYSKKIQIPLTAEIHGLLMRYITKCCNMCWFMMLQRPKLTLYPKEFKPVLKSVPFDTEMHSKTMGSDRKSSYVLYYVWPTVKNGDEKLGFNIQVIVRDTNVPMKRRKK